MSNKTGNLTVPVTKPWFDENEEQAVLQVLRSGWVTQGSKVAEFEQIFADYVGVKYAIAVSSATTALFLSLYVYGIGSDDEVIVPSFSFIASANVIVHVGAKPIFVDIDPDTYNLNPTKVEQAITSKTKAILCVDQVGLPCDLDSLKKIAKKHKLFLIEDAACALGSVYKGRRIGSICELTCFSFHPRKLITTGDGGIITTNNKKLTDRLKLLRHQGMGVSDVARHKSKKIIHENYPEVGFNFRLTDIQAAVGIEQMKKLDRILEKRAKLAEKYNQVFQNHPIIRTPFVPQGFVHNYQTYIVRILKNKKITRDHLMQKLLDVGISSRRGVMASHLEKPYRKLVGKIILPDTEIATDQTLLLPLYPQMTQEEQDYVISNVLNFTQV